jgi:hypothetical protein
MDASVEDTSSLDASALVSNRDGIAGTFIPALAVANRDVEVPANLPLWSVDRRAQLFDFEVMSRIGFSQIDMTDQFTVWHLSRQAVPGAAPPIVQYYPLVRVKRPPDDTYRQQTAIVAAYADLRDDRMDEILSQLDGNETFFASILSLHPERHRWTFEILDLVSRTAQFVEMRVKYGLAARRPSEYSAQIQPMLQVPGHASTPSGHSTEAFAAAMVLSYLTRVNGNLVYSDQLTVVQLFRQAARIAINRQVAGLHFPVDTAVGAVLGMTLGSYLVQRLTAGVNFNAWSFDGDAYDPTWDFSWSEYYDSDVGSVVFQLANDNPVALDDSSPILGWIWQRASEEWT